MRIGYFGGSFDPVHLGHTGLASDVLAGADLHRVVFLPAGRSPHKPECLASAEDRRSMIELAIADDHRFESDDRELERAGPSYTVDTMAEVASERPDDALFFLIGMDALHDLPGWRRIEDLARLVTFLVARRPGEDSAVAVARAEATGFLRFRVIETAARAVSSSALRARMSAGRDVAGWLHPAVASYVRHRGLYAPARGPSAENGAGRS